MGDKVEGQPLSITTPRVTSLKKHLLSLLEMDARASVATEMRVNEANQTELAAMAASKAWDGRFGGIPVEVRGNHQKVPAAAGIAVLAKALLVLTDHPLPEDYFPC